MPAGRKKNKNSGVDRINNEIPIGRVNKTSDVAALAVFLAGPGSRNITGQTINVDGGLLMHWLTIEFNKWTPQKMTSQFQA